MSKIARFILVSLLLLVSTLSVHAQTPVSTLSQLVIDFWPDYDQSSVLVLLTGTLPEGTALPAEVTIPLPADASVHVVARITQDGGMIDDVVYTTEGNQLRMTLPETRFRVEYYLPYTAVDSSRSFTFTWLSSTSVDEMLLAVQQPVAATDLATQPTAVAVAQSSTDGFTYHTLPNQAVPGGKPLTVSFNYTMNSPQLSTENLPVVDSGNETETAVAPPDASTADESPINWILLLSVAAIVVAAVALTWVVATQRTQTKTRKPQPNRSKVNKSGPAAVAPKKSAARYCHECGRPLQTGDQFCRNCGTAVKGK
jgi:hypothetical protein